MRTATSGATAPKGGGQRAACAACADEGPSRPPFLPIHAYHSGRSGIGGLGPVSSVIWSTVTLPAEPRHETTGKPAGHAGNRPTVTSSPGHQEMDLSARPRTTAGQFRARCADRAARHRKSRMRIPTDPRRATQTRSQGQRIHLSLGTFSALDLAERLAITPQNVNNRLKRLVEAGAIRRRRVVSSRGGKEFTYTAPAPCENVG